VLIGAFYRSVIEGTAAPVSPAELVESAAFLEAWSGRT
jgi:hypothetical protein